MPCQNARDSMLQLFTFIVNVELSTSRPNSATMNFGQGNLNHPPRAQGMLSQGPTVTCYVIIIILATAASSCSDATGRAPSRPCLAGTSPQLHRHQRKPPGPHATNAPGATSSSIAVRRCFPPTCGSTSVLPQCEVEGLAWWGQTNL